MVLMFLKEASDAHQDIDIDMTFFEQAIKCKNSNTVKYYNNLK